MKTCQGWLPCASHCPSTDGGWGDLPGPCSSVHAPACAMSVISALQLLQQSPSLCLGQLMIRSCEGGTLGRRHCSCCCCGAQGGHWHQPPLLGEGFDTNGGHLQHLGFHGTGMRKSAPFCWSLLAVSLLGLELVLPLFGSKVDLILKSLFEGIHFHHTNSPRMSVGSKSKGWRDRVFILHKLWDSCANLLNFSMWKKRS